jgi:small subunit ribosomal protein S16
MVKIRLTRVGAKKRPYYRIVAVDERRPRDGRPLAYLGIFDPCARPERVRLDKERIDAWIARGARPSPVVRTLLRKHGGAAPAEPAAGAR